MANDTKAECLSSAKYSFSMSIGSLSCLTIHVNCKMFNFKTQMFNVVYVEKVGVQKFVIVDLDIVNLHWYRRLKQLQGNATYLGV